VSPLAWLKFRSALEQGAFLFSHELQKRAAKAVSDLGGRGTGDLALAQGARHSPAASAGVVTAVHVPVFGGEAGRAMAQLIYFRPAWLTLALKEFPAVDGHL